MPQFDFTKSIEACASYYGDEADAVQNYMNEGLKAALNLPNRGPIRFNDDGSLHQDIAENGHTVEILLSASIEKLDKAMLDRFPNLKMIASISAGFSNIDLDKCKARNIAVANAPGMNSGDVADVAVTLMTSLLLNVREKHDFIMSDSWTTNVPPLRHSLRGMPGPDC